MSWGVYGTILVVVAATRNTLFLPWRWPSTSSVLIAANPTRDGQAESQRQRLKFLAGGPRSGGLTTEVPQLGPEAKLRKLKHLLKNMY